MRLCGFTTSRHMHVQNLVTSGSHALQLVHQASSAIAHLERCVYTCCAFQRMLVHYILHLERSIEICVAPGDRSGRVSLHCAC